MAVSKHILHLSCLIATISFAFTLPTLNFYPGAQVVGIIAYFLTILFHSLSLLSAGREHPFTLGITYTAENGEQRTIRIFTLSPLSDNASCSILYCVLSFILVDLWFTAVIMRLAFWSSFHRWYNWHSHESFAAYVVAFVFTLLEFGIVLYIFYICFKSRRERRQPIMLSEAGNLSEPELGRQRNIKTSNNERTPL